MQNTTIKEIDKKLTRGRKMENNMFLEYAKQVGEPIDPALPVPMALAEVADVFTAIAGEKVWRYSTFATSSDYVVDVDANGALTVVKRTPTGDAELTFKGMNSKLEYVLIDDILGETDNTAVLARRKASITRAMDKREVKLIAEALLAKTGSYLPGVDPHEHTVSSSEDLYDVILAMKHLVEDYGDNFVLLCGSTVKERIDTYDKDNVASFNYNITLADRLGKLGIKVIKMFGTVDVGAGEVAIMDAKKLILVARDSTIAEGKPIKFVRRIIGGDIAKSMGADVDKAQRAIIVNPTPVNVGGVNTLAYGVYGYESIIFTITNPKAIAICDATTILS